jgi:hypothetical protein
LITRKPVDEATLFEALIGEVEIPLVWLGFETGGVVSLKRGVP